MAREFTRIQLSGFDEFTRMTKTLAPRQARNLARSTTQAVASQIAKKMKTKAPKDDGTLRKAIKAKRRKMRGDVAISDVRVEHGARAKNDAWYWWFVENGTTKQAAQHYIRDSVTEIQPEIPAIYTKEFHKRLQKALEKQAKQQGVF
jgi:HK97 gp10 family phage protein